MSRYFILIDPKSPSAETFKPICLPPVAGLLSIECAEADLTNARYVIAADPWVEGKIKKGRFYIPHDHVLGAFEPDSPHAGIGFLQPGNE